MLVVICATTWATTVVPLAAQTQAGARSLKYLRDRAAALGLVAADLADVIVTSETMSEHSGVTHVYLRQRHRRIEITGAEITVNLARDGTISHAGTFVPNVASAARGQRARLGPREALERAAKYVDVESSALRGGTRPAKRVYHRTAPDRVRLAWQVEIETRDTQHHWVVTVDAESGALLEKFDRIVALLRYFHDPIPPCRGPDDGPARVGHDHRPRTVRSRARQSKGQAPRNESRPRARQRATGNHPARPDSGR